MDILVRLSELLHKKDNIRDMSKDKVDDLASEWVFETNGSKWSNNDDTAGDNYGSFKAGFDACEKVMYSEEEVYSLLEQSMKDAPIEGLTHGDYRNLKDWFKRFSKNGKERD